MLDGHIEQARRVDTGPMANMLAQGFHDDPAFVWMIPDEQARQDVLPPFFRGIIIGTLRNGVVLHRADNLAASLWRPPSRMLPGFLEIMGNLSTMMPFICKAASRGRRLAQAVQENCPDFPFRYLQSAVVSDGHRCQGMGTAIVKEGLERAATAGEPVYLETSSAENIAFFQNLGFEIISEWNVAPDSPRFTSMLKRP